MSLIQVNVPDIGDFSDVEVIEIFVAVGDTIKEDQSLLTVESDKASMEIPSSSSGVVKAIHVKLGDKINQGDLVLDVEEIGGAAEVAPVATPVVEEKPVEKAPVAAPVSAPTPVASPEPVKQEPYSPNFSTAAKGLPYAAPSVRAFARELGVDIHLVNGSGEKGRITKEDVRSFIKGVMTSGATPAAASSGVGLSLLDWPKVDFSKFGEIESKPLSRIKKISGANLHRNWVMIPHVTNNEEADVTDLEALRVQLNAENKKRNVPVKFTMLAFVIKAVVAALKKFPEFNTSLDGDNLVYKQYYHIGFAADTPNGLVVPVLKDADKKSISEIAQETSELAKMAREGKLGPAQMQGGCFTISSLGGIGGTNFTPIINAPEVAILGLSRSKMKPVWNGETFEPRLMLPMSLSYDHRVIDGAAAAKFNAYLAMVLADFRRAMI